jgi:pimeloyl-ACP methyl ester carboxylesterase
MSASVVFITGGLTGIGGERAKLLDELHADGLTDRQLIRGPTTTPRSLAMTTHTHQTAPTQLVEAKGVRFAYRRFGKSGGVPLVFNMHYMGTMDHWDPAVTDGFAVDREVILFDNAGVSSSSGEVPDTFAEMGANAIAFIRALGLKQVDVLGFSIGGLVSQEITLQAPDLVRRLVLVGTGPRSGEGMDTGTPEGIAIFGATYANPDDLWLRVQFTTSVTSQAAGREFIKRFRRRGDNRDPEVTLEAALRQWSAIGKWGVKRAGAWDYLKEIKQPTLVVNGSNDVIIYTVNSFILQQHLPNAKLILYPDSAHGSLFQYPDMFVRDVSFFLDQKQWA